MVAEKAAERVVRQGEYHGRGRATKSGITPEFHCYRRRGLQGKLTCNGSGKRSTVTPVVFGFSLNLRMTIPGRGVATTTPTWDAAWISSKQTLQSIDF